MICQWGDCQKTGQYIIHYLVAGDRVYCQQHAKIHIDGNPDLCYTILSRDSQKGHISEVQPGKRSF